MPRGAIKAEWSSCNFFFFLFVCFFFLFVFFVFFLFYFKRDFAKLSSPDIATVIDEAGIAETSKFGPYFLF